MRPAPFAPFSPLNLLSWRLSLASQAEADIQPPLHHGLVQGAVEVAAPLRAPSLGSRGLAGPSPCWAGAAPLLGSPRAFQLPPSGGPGARSWVPGWGWRCCRPQVPEFGPGCFHLQRSW